MVYFDGGRCPGMDQDAPAYTREMSESEIRSCLRQVPHGVLSLSDGDDSYAIPLYHHYEDGSLFFRLGRTPGDRKGEYVEAVDTATYVVYEAEGPPDAAVDRGWSVLARGPIERLPDDHPAHDRPSPSEEFPPLRLFDETRDDVDVALYELRPETLTGRQN